MASQLEQAIALIIEYKEKNGDLPKKQQRDIEKLGEIAKQAGEKAREAAELRAKGEERAAAAAEKAAARLESRAKDLTAAIQTQIDKQVAAKEKAAEKEFALAQKAFDKAIRDNARLAKEREKAIKASTAALADLESASGGIGRVGGAAKKGVGQLGEFSDAINTINGALGGLPGPAGQVASSLTDIVSAGSGAGAIFTAIVAGIGAFLAVALKGASQVADFATSIEKVVKVTGVLTSTATTFVTAFQAIGGGAEDVTDIFNQVAQVLVDAKNKAGDAEKNLRALGVTDFSNLDKAVFQIANGLATLPPSIEKTAAASAVLGEEGVRQFGAVADKIQATKQKLEEFGLTLDENATRNATQYKASLEDLNLAYQGFLTVVGKETQPAFTNAQEAATDLLKELSKSEEAKAAFRAVAEAVNQVAIVGRNTVPVFTEFLGVLKEVDKALPSVIKLFNGSPVANFFNAITQGQRAFQAQIEEQRKYEAQLKKTTDAQSQFVQEQIKSKEELERLAKAQNNLVQAVEAGAQREIAAIKQAAAEREIIEEDALNAIFAIEERVVRKRIETANIIAGETARAFQKGLATIDDLRAAEAKAEEARTALVKLESGKRIALAEKERKDTVAQLNQEVKDADEAERRKTESARAESNLKRSLIDKEIAQKRQLGATDQEIAQIELKNLDDTVAGIKKKIESLQDTQDAQNKIKDLQAELNRLEAERIGIAARASATVVKGKAEEKAAIEDAGEQARREIAAVEAQADRFLGGLGLGGQEAQKIVDSFAESIRTDLSGSIEELTAQEEKLRAKAEEINQEVQKLGKQTSVVFQAARIVIEEELEKIGEAIRDKIVKAELEALEERRKARIAAEQELIATLLQQAEELQERLLEIEKKRRDEIRKLKKQEADIEEDFAKDKADINQRLQDTIDDINEDARKKREADAKKEREDFLEAEREFQEEVKDIKNKAQQEDADKELDFIKDKGKLEGDLAAAQAALKSAKTQEEVAAAKADVDELLQQLAALEAKENARKQREKQRQQAIAQAQQQANEKLKNAKTKDEVDAIQKELDITVDGINQRFDLEEEFQENLADLQGRASAATIAALEANYRRQLDLLNERIANEKAANDAEAAQKAAARDAERAAEEKARQDQIADAQAAAAAELQRRQTEYDAQLNQLKDARKAIRREYQTSRNQIIQDEVTDAQKLAAALGVSAAAINAIFDAIINKGKDANEELKKLLGLANQLPGQGGSQSPATPGGQPPATGIGGGSGGGPAGRDPFAPGGGSSGLGGQPGGKSNITIAPSPTTTPTPPSGSPTGGTGAAAATPAGSAGSGLSGQQGANQNATTAAGGQAIDPKIIDKIVAKYKNGYKPRGQGKKVDLDLGALNRYLTFLVEAGTITNDQNGAIINAAFNGPTPEQFREIVTKILTGAGGGIKDDKSRGPEVGGGEEGPIGPGDRERPKQPGGGGGPTPPLTPTDQGPTDVIPPRPDNKLLNRQLRGDDVPDQISGIDAEIAARAAARGGFPGASAPAASSPAASSANGTPAASSGGGGGGGGTTQNITINSAPNMQITVQAGPGGLTPDSMRRIGEQLTALNEEAVGRALNNLLSQGDSNPTARKIIDNVQRATQGRDSFQNSIEAPGMTRSSF